MLHLYFSFRPDLEGILGFRLLTRKLFSLPSGKGWTLKLRPAKCSDKKENILNEYFTLGPSLTFRVPLLLNLQRSFNSNYKILEFVRKFKIFSISRVLRIRFPFGFSSRMMLLLWCVCGGFLQHFYDSSFLDILLKRNYEKPVDTAQDIINRNLKLITYPGAESIVEILKNSPSEVTRTLAERTIVAKVIFRYIKNIPL